MLARVKKNDLVMVIAGKHRKATGKVLRVLPEENRAMVERINIVKRHMKPRGPQSPGGIVEKEASIHLSNLMPMCERCNAPVRIGVRTLQDGTKARECQRCNELLDK
jgi:large subunit ribosomal protein L24